DAGERSGEETAQKQALQTTKAGRLLRRRSARAHGLIGARGWSTRLRDGLVDGSCRFRRCIGCRGRLVSLGTTAAEATKTAPGVGICWHGCENHRRTERNDGNPTDPTFEAGHSASPE